MSEDEKKSFPRQNVLTAIGFKPLTNAYASPLDPDLPTKNFISPFKAGKQLLIASMFKLCLKQMQEPTNGRFSMLPSLATMYPIRKCDFA
jgi:hypothetical protein